MAIPRIPAASLREQTLRAVQQQLDARGTKSLGELTEGELGKLTHGVLQTLPHLPASMVRAAILDEAIALREQHRTNPSSLLATARVDMALSRAVATQGRLSPLAAARFDIEVPVRSSSASPGHTSQIKKGFEWMPAEAPGAVGLATATARAAAALTAEDVKRGVLRGVIADDEIAHIENPNLVRFGLPAKQAGTVATQMRDTNAALFNPMAFDVAQRLEALRQRPIDELLRDAPGVDARVKALPHAPDGLHPTADVSEDMALDELFGTEAPYFERTLLIADSGSTPENSALPGHVFLRAPVGEYGEDLARALVDAARVLMREAAVVCADTSGSSAYAEVNAKLAFADELAGSWALGAEGMCSAVAAIMGKRVEGMSADDVLARLADGSALLQMASRPLYRGAEPLAESGYVSKEPVVIGANGTAKLPPGILGFARDLSAAREDFSADATSDYAQTHMHVGAPNSTETKRGCPLAAKAPMYDDSGKLAMPDTTAIEKLGAAYVELVRHILRERQGAG